VDLVDRRAAAFTSDIEEKGRAIFGTLAGA
jgi:hypothetical protein